MKQVKINVPDGYELKQEGNTYTVVKKEFKLEVGKDYVYERNEEEIIIDRKGDFGNVGFFNGKFVDDAPCLSPLLWREATEEEVIEAFKKECASRLGKNWVDVKIKKCMSTPSGKGLNKGKCIPLTSKTEEGWKVWNKNGCLYHNGKWAEKLEEPKFAECLEDIDRPWYLCTVGCLRESFDKEYQDKNHLPTEELTKGLLALIQLLSFRHDMWDKEGKPEDDYAWCIANTIKGELEVIQTEYGAFPFSFKSKETAEWFLETHEELLLEYFKKLVR